MNVENTKDVRFAYYAADARMNASALASLLTEDASMTLGWPLDGPYIGKRNIQKVFEAWYSDWGAAHPSVKWEVEEVRAVAVSENEVLSNWQWNMTSKAGAKAKLQGSYLFRFRGERIERIVGLWDIENTNRAIEDLEKKPSNSYASAST
jgi:ketosteroid isomerase-like protein